MSLLRSGEIPNSDNLWTLLPVVLATRHAPSECLKITFYSAKQAALLLFAVKESRNEYSFSFRIFE